MDERKLEIALRTIHNGNAVIQITEDGSPKEVKVPKSAINACVDVDEKLIWECMFAIKQLGVVCYKAPNEGCPISRIV